MIVEPGFLDHWKTQALIRVTNDPASPLMILRLWEHCQLRKTSRFLNLPEAAITSICRWSKNPAELLPILIECGWVTRDGEAIIIHDWSETNRILVSAWKNGTKGGRPRKLKVLKKPTGKPTDNRSGTDPSPLSTLSISGTNGEKDSKEKPNRAPPDFLASLKTNLFYSGIDIDRELELAQKWCKRKNRRCTQRFFENWLGKADRLVEIPKPERKPVPEAPQPPAMSDEEAKEVARKMRQLREQMRMPT